MKKLEIQTNFTAGELSPRLYSHVDTSKYKDGLKTALNCNILPHGPVSRRNGSQYIASTKDSTKISRLIRFQFNQTNAYILEFGNNYIRFYKNGAQIQSGMSAYEISTPWADTDVFNITYVQFGTTIFFAHFNTPPQQLVWSGDTSWTLSQMIFSPPATTEDGYTPSGITVTPGATSGLGITFTASGAVFLAADVGREIINLGGNGKASIASVTDSTHVVCDIVQNFPSTSTIAAGSWKMDLSPIAALTPNGNKIGSVVTINAVDPTLNGTFSPNVTLTPGATTGSGITFTAGAPAFVSAHVGYRIVSTIGAGDGIITAVTDSTHVVVTITQDWPTTGAIAATNWQLVLPIDTFRSADIGRYIKILNGVGTIIAVNSASQIVVSLEKSMNAQGSTQAWSIEDPSWNNTNGYPRIVGLYQQRLVFGSTSAAPQSIWMSASGTFDSLGVGSADADALELDIVTNQANQLNWMVPLRGDLVFGTFGGENSVSGGGGQSPITPSTASQLTRSYNGGNLQQAIVIGYEGLYIQRSNRKVMAIKYNFLVDTYESEDLTFLAEHITKGLIKEIVYSQDPDRRIYGVLLDGTMIVGTYYKEQQVMGWSKYNTNGSYESVQTITTGAFTEVWVIVNRTIQGSTVRYIERFDIGDGTSPIDGFSDCYLFYYQPITITGITNATQAVITAPSHGLSNGNSIKIINLGIPASTTFLDGIGITTPASGMYEISHVTLTVANVTTDTFKVKDSSGNYIDSTSFSSYINGGTVHLLVTTISGLTHLIGQTVQIKQDGAASADQVVNNSGQITLPTPGYAVTVGLQYNMIAHSLSKEYNVGSGSQQGQQGRLVRPILRLVNSEFPMLNGEYKPARTPQDNMDAALPLFSGDVVYGGMTWSANIEFDIQMSSPFPCIVCGIFGSLEGGVQ